MVQTFERHKDELIHLFADDEQITTTEEHPFYVPQRGWVDAGQLLVGDELVLYDGRTVVIEKVWRQYLCAPVSVYNFEVEEFHTYFVGDDAVLVHNLCDGKWAKGGRGSSLANAKYHYNKHGAEVGTKSISQYTKRATDYANTVVKKGIAGKSIHGRTANVYRYFHKNNYIDMVEKGGRHLLVSFGRAYGR